MFGSLGGPELILILVVALIVFGPRRLPDIGKSVGKMLVEFRRASNEFKRTVEDEVESEKRAAQSPQLRAPLAPAPPAAEDAAGASTDTTSATPSADAGSGAPDAGDAVATPPPGTVAQGDAAVSPDAR